MHFLTEEATPNFVVVDVTLSKQKKETTDKNINQ
jgi:hypothetical protein